MRDAMKLDIYHSILIFDEAHNIEKLSEDGCSFTLSMRDLENCEGDFKLLRQRVKQGEDCKITDDDIDLLEFPIQSLAKSMTAMKKEMDREKRQSKSHSFWLRLLIKINIMTKDRKEKWRLVETFSACLRK